MTPTAPEIPQGNLVTRSTSRARQAYTIPRYRVMLVKESGATAGDVRISDSNKAHRFFAPLFDGLDREHFLVVDLACVSDYGMLRCFCHIM